MYTQTPDDLRERGRPQILSMPRVIQRAGLMSRDAEGDNPYADMALLKLENALDLATTEIQKLVDELEATLKAIPTRISLTDVSSVSPLNIGVFSSTPLGYRCVWLRSRVNPPVKITSHPQRVGSHSCLALHFKGTLCSSIDLLISVNSQLSWPTEDDYHHPRWYMTVVDAADLMYLTLYIERTMTLR